MKHVHSIRLALIGVLAIALWAQADESATGGQQDYSSAVLPGSTGGVRGADGGIGPGTRPDTSDTSGRNGYRSSVYEDSVPHGPGAPAASATSDD